MLYFVLGQSSSLAKVMGDAKSAGKWSKIAAAVQTSANDMLWDPSANLYRDNETTTLYPQDGNVWAIKAGLPKSVSHKANISRNLRSRWGKFGAPAPEAGNSTISPFISGFEIQAHYIAGAPQSALDLIRLQWGFMLDDPRMTQSTFIEGYSTDGSLAYAPYPGANPRLSFAHGWSTGPTSALTNYAAGLQLTGAGGKTWKIAPSAGSLTLVDAGISTPLGQFSITYEKDAVDAASYRRFEFLTPPGTVGEVNLPGVEGRLVRTGQDVLLRDGIAKGLRGGKWVLYPHC
jgi:hypothetical protein